MKIAVFIKSTTFHSNYGGLETQNKTVCEGLVHRGHEVTVFSPLKNLKMEEATENGVKYVFISASYKYFLAALYPNSWENKSFKVFSERQENEKFELVISQSTAGIGILKNKKELGIPVISIAHGTTVGELKTHLQNIKNVKDLYWGLRNLQYSLRQFFGRQRQYILLSDRVIAVSNAVKSQILEETFAPENLIRVVPNGVDPTEFTDNPGQKNNNPVRLVFTSRVIRSKGIFDFVEILKSLKHLNIVLDVIGDGEAREEFSRLIREERLEEKVNFVGKISHHDLLKMMPSEDIFVLPTHRFEGFPMTVVEAMLAGLPSVVYNVGGTSDAIEDGITGYLIQPDNLKGFTEKVELLTTDHDLRLKMGQTAREKALREFTTDIMLDKYEKIITEVVL